MNKPEAVPDIPVMNIDEKQYALADLTPNQNAMISQIKDLEDQLRLNEFKHQQLVHGRTAYVTSLKESLESPTDNSDPEPPALEGLPDGSKPQ